MVKEFEYEYASEFLKLEVSEDGAIQPSNANYNLFSKGEYTDSDGVEKLIKKKLKIATIDNGDYLRYEGQFPVIIITMRKAKMHEFIGEAPSYTSIRNAISEAYHKNYYILKILTSKMINEPEPFLKSNFQYDIDRFTGYLNCDQLSDLDDSISFLMNQVLIILAHAVFLSDSDKSKNTFSSS